MHRCFLHTVAEVPTVIVGGEPEPEQHEDDAEKAPVTPVFTPDAKRARAVQEQHEDVAEDASELKAPVELRDIVKARRWQDMWRLDTLPKSFKAE